MIKQIKNNSDLKKFVSFTKKHYESNAYFVHPLYNVLYKELKQVVLVKKEYTALLFMENNQIKGRLLYTVAPSKQQNQLVCYFSHFEAINDLEVVRELFFYLEEDMKQRGIYYVEGSFTPYDPDTRRGILVKGFVESPTLFTSYNYEYYSVLLEGIGYKKAFDTVAIAAPMVESSFQRIAKMSRYFQRHHSVRIDSIHPLELEKDIDDIATILKESSGDVIYQDAPDSELLRKIAKQLRFFLRYNLIKIAREKDTLRPVGFCFTILDYNQLFSRTKGKLRILWLLMHRKDITRVKGQLQYIVPDYQDTGLLAYIYDELIQEFLKMGINQFEAGTIMEENTKSINAIKHFTGEISKVYRLYGKELNR